MTEEKKRKKRWVIQLVANSFLIIHSIIAIFICYNLFFFGGITIYEPNRWISGFELSQVLLVFLFAIYAYIIHIYSRR